MKDIFFSRITNNCVKVVKSIIDQSHLCPLPQKVKPILSSFDHSLRLYPLPHSVRTVFYLNCATHI